MLTANILASWLSCLNLLSPEVTAKIKLLFLLDSYDYNHGSDFLWKVINFIVFNYEKVSISLCHTKPILHSCRKINDFLKNCFSFIFPYLYQSQDKTKFQ